MATLIRKCMVCGIRATNGDLCAEHYPVYARWASTSGPRPERWGQKSKHPLWQRWKGYPRYGGREAIWDDFWKFVSDVGTAPSDRHHLARSDEKSPWGPKNFEWRERLDIPVEGLARRSAYMKSWRERNYAKVRAREMERHHGISMEEYGQLSASQGDACAICGGRDSHFRLAIDHDHETGQNRGLLCAKCNRGLGLFSDSPARLEIAAAYIRKWCAIHQDKAA